MSLMRFNGNLNNLYKYMLGKKGVRQEYKNLYEVSDTLDSKNRIIYEFDLGNLIYPNVTINKDTFNQQSIVSTHVYGAPYPMINRYYQKKFGVKDSEVYMLFTYRLCNIFPPRKVKRYYGRKWKW